MTFEPGPANPQPFSAGVPLVPSFDVIEVLPPAAAERLRMLRQCSADAHAVIPPFAVLQEASVEKIAAGGALKRLLDHPHDGGFGLPPDDSRVIAAQRKLDKLTVDFERVKELNEVRSAAW